MSKHNADDVEGKTLDGDRCPLVEVKQGGTYAKNLEEKMESSAVAQSRREEREMTRVIPAGSKSLDLMHGFDE